VGNLPELLEMSLSGDYRPLLSEISREKATKKKKKKKCGIKVVKFQAWYIATRTPSSPIFQVLLPCKD
jgi:hypothetical protein